MNHLSSWSERNRNRSAWVVLGTAMAVAAALILWETRGFTLFVDEWGFGFGARTGWSPSELLSPDNGHLAIVPILITKVWLQVFGASSALPLRILAVGIHLTTALLLFVLLRRSIGDLAALLPVVLLLFFGSTFDVILGSHALPIQIAVVTGLAAWLALSARTALGDVAAAILLTVGVASNGFAFPFIAIAAAIILVDRQSSWRRLWVPAAPLVLWGVWWLGYAAGGQSEFAISNLGSLPTFSFDSLGAELGAVTGLYTVPGSFAQGFNLGPGEALAGAALVAILVLVVGRGYRPTRAMIPALVGLIVVWISTGMVASAARQPDSIRYLYGGAIILLVLVAEALAASPLRRQGLWVLAGVCAVSLLPNVREIRYGAALFRAQSNQDRAVLAAADLVAGQAPGNTILDIEEDQVAGGVPDLGFSLQTYIESKQSFGTPAYSLAELEGSDPTSREAADRLIARALPIDVTPASGPPSALPSDLEPSTADGSLSDRHGCIVFTPSVANAWLTLHLPPHGLWIRPESGSPVGVRLRRFADTFAVAAGPVLGGRPSELSLPPGPASTDWEARLSPDQPTTVCGLAGG